MRKEADVQVEVVSGSRGEFTVLVNDEVVASKGELGESLPTVDEVLIAVRKARPVADSRK